MRNNNHDSRRAQIKCKLLTETYILQANRAAFNQYAVNSTCKLCSAAPETRQHFIGECVFEAERKTYIEKLSTIKIHLQYFAISNCPLSPRNGQLSELHVNKVYFSLHVQKENAQCLSKNIIFWLRCILSWRKSE